MASRYSAIIFDLFGTLVPPYRHHDVLSEMARVLGLEAREFISAFAEDTRDSRESGDITLEANLRSICELLGHAATGPQLERAVAVRRRFTRAALAPRNDALKVLSDLKARRLSIGLISDCCEVVSQLWEATALARYIDACILSCRVGIRKPDRRIYDFACNALSVEPSRCLYVGDGGSHELTGAVQAGMNAVLLFVEAERDLDPYRPDARTWTGTTIESLGELMDYLARG
jgi:putative hydrolase of the HAD superfamily